MRILANLFPPGETFGVLFRGLLPVSIKLGVAIPLICGTAAFFGADSIVVGGTPIRGLAGFMVSLLVIPPAVLTFALIGACYLYVGRKIPFVRAVFAPQSDFERAQPTAKQRSPRSKAEEIIPRFRE